MGLQWILTSATLNNSLSSGQNRKFTDPVFNILLCISRSEILAKFLLKYLKWWEKEVHEYSRTEFLWHFYACVDEFHIRLAYIFINDTLVNLWKRIYIALTSKLFLEIMSIHIGKWKLWIPKFLRSVNNWLIHKYGIIKEWFDRNRNLYHWIDNPNQSVFHIKTRAYYDTVATRKILTFSHWLPYSFPIPFNRISVML